MRRNEIPLLSPRSPRCRRIEDFRVFAILTIVFLLSVFASPIVPAQEAASGPNDGESIDLADRDRQFAELARDAAAFERQMKLLRRIVDLAKPSVVHVEAKKIVPGSSRYRRRSIEETGSGVIVRLEDTNCIVTNLHVVRGAQERNILIKLFDGRKIHPTRVLSDPETDVAVMQIDAKSLYPARLGDSNLARIGDPVLAYGSPFGLSHSVTFGIISAKSRRDLELDSSSIGIQNFIQTDAAINPGNSGGPLLNLRGEVIGLNTAIASNSGGNDGIGFSIPMNSVVVIAQQLLTQGRVHRAYLGVNMDDTFDADKAAALGLRRLRGVLVTGVTANSPAAAAEIRPNDIILDFDGIAVEDLNHLRNLVKLTPVGKRVSVVILRDKQEFTLNVPVADRQQFDTR